MKTVFRMALAVFVFALIGAGAITFNDRHSNLNSKTIVEAATADADTEITIRNNIDGSTQNVSGSFLEIDNKLYIPASLVDVAMFDFDEHVYSHIQPIFLQLVREGDYYACKKSSNISLMQIYLEKDEKGRINSFYQVESIMFMRIEYNNSDIISGVQVVKSTQNDIQYICLVSAMLQLNGVDHGSGVEVVGHQLYGNWVSDSSNFTIDIFGLVAYFYDTHENRFNNSVVLQIGVPEPVYRFSFLDYKGYLKYTFTGKEGALIEAPLLSTPAGRPDEPTGQTFVGWSFSQGSSELIKFPLKVTPALQKVFYAAYETNAFTVTFIKYTSSEVLYVFALPFGANISEHIPLEISTLAGYRRVTYYDNEPIVNQNKTVYVHFALHSVLFLDVDGDTIESYNVLDGDACPEPFYHFCIGCRKGIEEGKHYEFYGWDKDFSVITEDLIVRPIIKFYCEVTFLDYDEKTVIEKQKIFAGDAPVPPSVADNRFGYSFFDWRNYKSGRYAITSCKEDSTFVAVYKNLPKFSIYFYYPDHTLITVNENVFYGTKISYPSVPSTFETYSFLGWSEELDFITRTMSVYAKYNCPFFTIQYVNLDGSIIDTQRVQKYSTYNQTVLPEYKGYKFSGWSETAYLVENDMVIYAEYFPSGWTSFWRQIDKKELISYASLQSEGKTIDDIKVLQKTGDAVEGFFKGIGGFFKNTFGLLGLSGNDGGGQLALLLIVLTAIAVVFLLRAVFSKRTKKVTKGKKK